MRLIAAALFLLFSLLPAPAVSAEFVPYEIVSIGLKYMHGSDWEAPQDQVEFRWEQHFTFDGVGPMLGLGLSYDGDLWGVIAEARLGVQWWRDVEEGQKVHYGFGASWLHVYMDIEETESSYGREVTRTESDSESAIGVWVSGRAVLDYSWGMIGFGLGLSYAKVNLFGRDQNAGALHMTLTYGARSIGNACLALCAY